jgi:hypothetical protein
MTIKTSKEWAKEDMPQYSALFNVKSALFMHVLWQNVHKVAQCCTLLVRMNARMNVRVREAPLNGSGERVAHKGR